MMIIDQVGVMLDGHGIGHTDSLPPKLWKGEHPPIAETIKQCQISSSEFTVIFQSFPVLLFSEES